MLFLSATETKWIETNIIHSLFKTKKTAYIGAWFNYYELQCIDKLAIERNFFVNNSEAKYSKRYGKVVVT